MSVVINRVTPSVVSPSSAVGERNSLPELPPDSLINDDDESMLAAFLSTFAAQGQVANRIQVKETDDRPNPPGWPTFAAKCVHARHLCKVVGSLARGIEFPRVPSSERSTGKYQVLVYV